MSARPVAIYRTADADLVAQYHANGKAVDDNREAVKVFLAKYDLGDRKLYGSRLFAGGATFRGVLWDRATDIPEGWRMPVDNPIRIEPKRTTKVGKAIDAEMRALRMPSVKRNLAMPAEIFDVDHHHCYWFGLAERDGVLWVSWGVDPEVVRDKPKIGEQWERVPLSEYYGLVEDGRDPFADGGAE